VCVCVCVRVPTAAALIDTYIEYTHTTHIGAANLIGGVVNQEYSIYMESGKKHTLASVYR